MISLSGRRKLRGWQLVVCGVIAITFKLCSSLFGEIEPSVEQYAELPSVDLMQQSSLAASRHLLSASELNCTPRAIENFPKDFFTQDQRRQGFVAVHLAVALYMFLALAIACDEYFVPSLEGICEFLNLQPDVAGATFMAAGSSAPELAATVIGVFIAKDDIGLGAVVGSAVFNIMFVISVCALFSGMVVYLKWWPLFRDSAFYAISIIALVLIILDGQVTWYESLALLLLYFLYIFVMFFNRQLDDWITPKFICCDNRKRLDECELITTKSSNGKITAEVSPSDTEDSEEDDPSGQLIRQREDLMIKQPMDDEEEESVLSLPDGCCRRLLWVLSLPLVLPMFITIPDCRQKRWKKCFFLTFAMSCVWISLHSYLLIWMVTIIGRTLNIPDTVMGLTFLAAGVSIPDAIASLIVVREGQGDMAVSNAVGSNVFDILLCMGLPWFLRTAVIEPGSVVIVYSEGLTYSALTLLTTVVFLILATHLNGWKLDIKYGVVLMIVYFLFLAMATLYELNIFGYVHPPECPTHY